VARLGLGSAADLTWLFVVLAAAALGKNPRCTAPGV
jgi:hypothetical protein